MTVEDFEREMNDLGQEIRDVATGHVLDILAPMIDRIRLAAPFATGRLKASIGATLGPEYTIQFVMNYYGPFQNYGVSGTNDSFGVEVPSEVEPTPSNGNNYAFTKRRFGIPPKDFFDLDQMRTEIVEGLQRRVEELTQN